MTVSPPACDDALVDLFAALGCSLLQYLDEADPWTDAAHADASAVLDRLAAAQRQSYTEIAELLARRHVLPELSTYPSQFATLHYLALDYLATCLVADQLGVVATCDAALTACGSDPASSVLQEVRAREAEHFDELRRLVDTLRSTPPISP